MNLTKCKVAQHQLDDSLEPCQEGKNQRLDGVMRDAIIQSSLLQEKQRTHKNANEALSAAIKITSEENLNMHGLWQCNNAARIMKDILFSVGDAKRVVAALRCFND